MIEEYMEPELKVVCFASEQCLAVSIDGGEGNVVSNPGSDEDLGLDIL